MCGQFGKQGTEMQNLEKKYYVNFKYGTKKNKEIDNLKNGLISKGGERKK